MAAKKFYAIAVGRKPGIYEEWPIAQAQVQGYPGAVFKGFPTREEARSWLEKPACTTGGAGRKKVSDHGGRLISTALPETLRKKSPGAPAKEESMPRDGEVTIYTDGGARYNPGPGGYGVVQLYGGVRRELSGGYRHTTNNRMELMGCIVALRDLEHRDRPVTLYSDSSYVVNGISKGWAKSWRKKGWLKSDGQPAVNPDLWTELLDLVDGLDIAFIWVKGHAGHPMNERCDELAVAAARHEGLPADPGYPG